MATAPKLGMDDRSMPPTQFTNRGTNGSAEKKGLSVSNQKAEDAANKIMLAFDFGGLVPLDLHQYTVIDAHVRSILGRAMETPEEKRKRKWDGFQRAIKEHQ
jgi:hypothetical protein